MRRTRVMMATVLAMLAGGCVARAPAPTAATPVYKTSKEVVDAAGPGFFREIPADELMLVDLANGKRVTIQLAPRFAPVHVANLRLFALNRFWDGATIYRVQDGFVVQWGRNDDGRTLPPGVVAKPPAEYALPVAASAITPLGYADAYTDLPGFLDGWPVAYDRREGSAALAHCYGVVGAGRDLAPDTGVGVELYAVIGQAPRRLERNITAVGRVIDGFEAMTALPRGHGGGLGLYEDKAMEVPIQRVRLASQLPTAGRPRYEAMDSAHPLFPAYLKARAATTNEFYNRAAGAVDLCGLSVMTRKVEAK